VLVGTILLAVGRLVGRVEVQENPLWGAMLAALSHVEFKERPSDAQVGSLVRSVLETGDGGLARQICTCFWQRAANQFQEQVTAKVIGVVLVFVTAGYVVDSLPNQRCQWVAD
jgi:hypothetical protein